ncbi:CPBP family intramembrane glutamic endopeptidase [Pseudonocardia sp. TRM90224]|uniref:CPBP family intramembrane glutamic endopeptidase n=1 Tax=Pseudonocardia sp. TRM90224 TaxID=2812678 RepID=UPI001E2FC1A9|nr:type II CAAX endopeptidase family protein [Pseudonocardia sp. TRM90224]
MSTEVSSAQRPALGWRIAAVFVGVVAIWLLVIKGLDPFFGPAYEDRLGHAVRAVLVAVLAVPLVLLARRHLDRRPIAGLGLAGPRLRPLLFGMACWAVPAALGILVSTLAGWGSITIGALDAPTLVLIVALPVLVVLYEALPEELIFRGYLYRNLATRLPRWAAVIGQAVLFTAWGGLIGAADGWERYLLFFTFSIVLGVLRVVTGSLWATMGFHLAFQWFTQWLSAAQQAGGATVEGRADLEFVSFWLLPIVIGTVVLLAAIGRGRDWAQRDPE